MEILNSWLVNKYIAHHGLHDDASPQNSLGAITKAVQKDYAILLSVRSIADGTAIIFHDEILKHMTLQDGYVANISSKDNLKNYKLNGTKETIPTLIQALKVIDGKVPVILDVKNFGKVGKLEQVLFETLKEYKGEYAITSLNPYVLEWFKINAPTVLRGQVSCVYKNNEFEIKLPHCKRRRLKKMKYNTLSQPNFIIYEVSGLRKSYLKKFRDIPLLAKIIKSQHEYITAAPYCDNIIFEGFVPHI